MDNAKCSDTLSNISYISEYSSKNSMSNRRQLGADSGLIPLTNRRTVKFTAIEGVAIYPIEELRELPREQVEALYERSLKARGNLECEQSLLCIELSEHNFSERVHWRKNQRALVDMLYKGIAAVTEKLEYLKSYLSLLNGHRLKFVFLEEQVKPPVKVTVGAHIEVDLEDSKGDTTIYSLYIGPNTDPNKFSANVEKQVKGALTKFDVKDATISPANDLLGAIEVSWTYGQNKDDTDHVDTCKRVHEWLDRLILPSFRRHYTLNENREEYVGNFDKSVLIKSTGLVWFTPSSMWISKQTTRVMMFTLARLAVQYGVTHRLVPTVIAEEPYIEWKMAA